MTTQAQQPTLKGLLVVEDEVFIAEALTTALRHARFDTRCVFTGHGALELAREWSPALSCV